MVIPKYAKKNFQPDPNDDKQTAIQKKYFLEKDRTYKKMFEQNQEQKEQNYIEKFKNELNKMKGKTSLEELERAYFINEIVKK